MKVVCNNGMSVKKNSIKGTIVGHSHLLRQKIDSTLFQNEAKKTTTKPKKSAGGTNSGFSAATETNSRIKNSPILKKTNNSSSSPGTRFPYKGTCEILKTNRESKHSKNISNEAKENYTGFNKRQVIIGPSNVMGSPLSKKSQPVNKIPHNSVNHSHSKKRKTVSNIEDRNVAQPQSKRPKQIEQFGEEFRMNRQTIESLAILRMDSANIRAVLSNKQFRIKHSVSRELNMIENIFASLSESMEILKASMIRRITEQSELLNEKVNGCVKKVGFCHRR